MVVMPLAGFRSRTIKFLFRTGVEFSYLDGAVLEVRVIVAACDRLAVISGLDQVVTAQQFFGFDVRSVGNAYLALAAAHHSTGFIGQLGSAQLELLLIGFLSPGPVTQHPLLLLLRTELHPRLRIGV